MNEYMPRPQPWTANPAAAMSPKNVPESAMRRCQLIRNSVHEPCANIKTRVFTRAGYALT